VYYNTNNQGGTPMDDEDNEVLEGEVDEIVYECWIGGERGSFTKLEPNNVVIWVSEQLESMRLHQTLHIVQHSKSEYTS
jgi:hypothetical protein